MPPLTTPAAHRIDCSRKSAGSKSTSTTPSRAASFGLSCRFCCMGLLTMTSRAFSGPMRLGSSHAPPQPGMSPRKTSGSDMAAAPYDMVR